MALNMTNDLFDAWAVAHSVGSGWLFPIIPGAYAPGFTLPSAPRTRCTIIQLNLRLLESVPP
jgi:hypothetical protein